MTGEDLDALADEMRFAYLEEVLGPPLSVVSWDLLKRSEQAMWREKARQFLRKTKEQL